MCVIDSAWHEARQTGTVMFRLRHSAMQHTDNNKCFIRSVTTVTEIIARRNDSNSPDSSETILQWMEQNAQYGSTVVDLDTKNPPVVEAHVTLKW